MTTIIRFGDGNEIELTDDAVVNATIGCPMGESLDDVVAATAASLVDPLDFPPIDQAVIPSDQVVIAVDSDLPQPGAVIAGIVQSLVSSGVPPDQISIVTASLGPTPESLLAMLPADQQKAIQAKRHDPSDMRSLALLAVAANGEPIYVNRRICDADFVIPVGTVAVDMQSGEHLVEGVFPSFADLATQARLRATSSKPAGVDSNPTSNGREVEEATWLLGTRLTVQLVWGQGDELLHVTAGDYDSVYQHVSRVAANAWNVDVEQRAPLVIAAIEGGPIQQTWKNLIRAITAAVRIAEPHGAIAVCCELEESPSPGIQLMMGAASLDDAESELREQMLPGAELALSLIDVLRDHPVYLYSRLKENDVIDLGMACISQPDELNNLAKRLPSATLLLNAQHIWPTLESPTHS